MMIVTYFLDGIRREVTFYIGTNKYDNFEAIDQGKPSDIWFHAKNETSCHVVAVITDEIKPRDMKHIIQRGAFICKNQTNKLRDKEDVEIIYTRLENVEKTDEPGCVKMHNFKSIIV